MKNIWQARLREKTVSTVYVSDWATFRFLVLLIGLCPMLIGLSGNLDSLLAATSNEIRTPHPVEEYPFPSKLCERRRPAENPADPRTTSSLCDAYHFLMIAQAEGAALEEDQRDYDEFMDPLAMQRIDRSLKRLRQAIMSRLDTITGQLREIKKLLEKSGSGGGGPSEK